MSVLHVEGHEVFRVFSLDEPLTTSWEPLRTVRSSDSQIIKDDDAHEVSPDVLPLQHDAVQGAGWLMLSESVELVEAEVGLPSVPTEVALAPGYDILLSRAS